MSFKIKLLIVDDEINFLDSISKPLSTRGFDVTTTADGQDAINKARCFDFDLALIDMKMPGMDGEETLKIIKEENQYIEAIILTGHGSFEEGVDMVENGAFGYMHKPFELEDLIDKLRDAFRARLENKFKTDSNIVNRIMEITAEGNSQSVLQKLKELDNG